MERRCVLRCESSAGALGLCYSPLMAGSSARGGPGLDDRVGQSSHGSGARGASHKQTFISGCPTDWRNALSIITWWLGDARDGAQKSHSRDQKPETKVQK